jgi:hypothetical protein
VLIQRIADFIHRIDKYFHDLHHTEGEIVGEWFDQAHRHSPDHLTHSPEQAAIAAASVAHKLKKKMSQNHIDAA